MSTFVSEEIQMFCLTVRHKLFGDNSCAFLFRGYVCDNTDLAKRTLAEDKKLFLTNLVTSIKETTGRTFLDVDDYDTTKLPDDGELGVVIAEALK